MGEGHFQRGIPTSEFGNTVDALENKVWNCQFPEQEKQDKQYI
jgi:hypothetical protein